MFAFPGDRRYLGSQRCLLIIENCIILERVLDLGVMELAFFVNHKSYSSDVAWRF